MEGTLSNLHLLTGGRLTNAAAVPLCPSVGAQLKKGVFKTRERIEALDVRLKSGTLFRLVDEAEYFIANNIRRRFVVTGKRTRDEIPEDTLRGDPRGAHERLRSPNLVPPRLRAG